MILNIRQWFWTLRIDISEHKKITNEKKITTSVSSEDTKLHLIHLLIYFIQTQEGAENAPVQEIFSSFLFTLFVSSNNVAHCGVKSSFCGAK